MVEVVSLIISLPRSAAATLVGHCLANGSWSLAASVQGYTLLSSFPYVRLLSYFTWFLLASSRFPTDSLCHHRESKYMLRSGHSAIHLVRSDSLSMHCPNNIILLLHCNISWSLTTCMTLHQTSQSHHPWVWPFLHHIMPAMYGRSNQVSGQDLWFLEIGKMLQIAVWLALQVVQNQCLASNG
jgi:hypothetical protein